jgi:Na+-transporting methylmalonyl-CoA/oxaloacetate decarboxylase gamma subunit
MDGLTLTLLALAAVTFLVLFAAVFLMIGVGFFTRRYLKKALDWLLPPFENQKKTLCNRIARHELSSGACFKNY